VRRRNFPSRLAAAEREDIQSRRGECDSVRAGEAILGTVGLQPEHRDRRDVLSAVALSIRILEAAIPAD